MTIDELRFSSIGQVQDQYLNNKVPKTNSQKPLPTGEGSFAQVLNKIQEQADNNSVARESLKFSKHAANRLNDRSIELTQDQMLRLNQGAKEASEKGLVNGISNDKFNPEGLITREELLLYGCIHT